MADKQLAYNASRNADVFADDDPLAELARIVGFDPRPSSQAPAADRRDPAFDLEDELLQEFERYDAPRRVDVASVPRDLQHMEPANDVVSAPVVEDLPQEPVFEAVDFQPVMEAAPPLSEQSIDALIEAEIQSRAPAEPVQALSADLADELELSVSPTPVAPFAKAPQWSAASIRLPIANFHAASSRSEPVVQEAARLQVEPAVAEAPQAVSIAPVYAPETAAVEPTELGFFAEHDRHEDAVAAPVEEADFEFEIDDAGFSLSDAAKDGLVSADAALTEPAYSEKPTDAAFDIDDLLADVSKYPVPARERTSSIVLDEAFEALMNEPAFAEKMAFVPTPAPVALAMPAKAELDAEDPFSGQDFEFDLEGIELELADLDFAVPEPVAPAPAVAAPAYYTPAPSVAFETRPHVDIAPAAPIAAGNDVFSLQLTIAAPEADEFEAELNLPFDPSGISDADEHPEAVEDMHIPTLPPVDETVHVVKQPDFDFDIDAEMASLFDSQPRRSSTPVDNAHANLFSWDAATSHSAETTRVKSLDDFDEFERALEEDFRRSINEPVRKAENVARMSFEPSSVVADRQRARSMRGMAAAAALIIIFGAGAYAAYQWVFDGSPLGVASGDPKVIVADKDPVKVVPENPGGKTVPNQDKAVYDRVGGAAAEDPKQKTLISSDEEPVDVVQKTLIPEDAAAADDGDGADVIASTPVGDTQDPRLLPNQDTAQAANGDDVPSVSPRKVRTMIVKPDGTLVAREDPTPAPTAATLPAATEVASADLRTSPTEDVPATTQPALPLETAAPIAAAPTTPAPAVPAENADAPVRVVKTSKIADTAPVPTARPAEQPVKVAETATDKSKVKPVAVKPTEVAAVTPKIAAPAPAASVAAATGSYGMQIASLPSEAEAKRSFSSLSSKFSGVLSGRSYEIRKAEIAGKGTYYRVRIPAGSKDAAAALCQQYRQAGGTCLISK